MRQYRPDLAPARVTIAAVSSYPELIRELAPVGMVIAIRYHNVMCALKLCKPTISLGYARKFIDLMSDMGLAEFNQFARSADVDRLIEQFKELESRHGELAQQMAARNAARAEPRRAVRAAVRAAPSRASRSTPWRRARARADGDRAADVNGIGQSTATRKLALNFFLPGRSENPARSLAGWYGEPVHWYGEPAQRREQMKKYSTASFGPTTRNVNLQVHISGFQQCPGRLAAVPVVRGREVAVNGKVAGQTLPEGVERLNVAERLENVLVPVPEVRIGHHELAVRVRSWAISLELLVLTAPTYSNRPKSAHDIEFLAAWEIDGLQENIVLDQVRCWLVDGDVDPVVADVRARRCISVAGPQPTSSRSRVAPPASSVDDPGRLLQPVVRRDVLLILLDPEIALVKIRGISRRARQRRRSCSQRLPSRWGVTKILPRDRPRSSRPDVRMATDAGSSSRRPRTFVGSEPAQEVSGSTLAGPPGTAARPRSR